MFRGLKWLIALSILGLTPTAALGETQNTVSLTASQMLPGDSGSFTSTQSSGASANASGTLYHTYAGAMKFHLSSASGRYEGFAGTDTYGIDFGPFILFRSFLSANFFTIVSSSTMCPGTNTYNWMNVRVRSPFPTTSSFAMDATKTTFYPGGTMTFNQGAAHIMTGNSLFDLNGPTINNSPSYYFDGLSGATCASGQFKAVAGGTDVPLDARGTFFFGDNTFFYLSSGGNPLVTIGTPQQTLSGPGMATIANSAFTGMYTAFGNAGTQTATQDQRNVLVFPDASGTTFTVYNANDLNDPSNKTTLGTLACTSLNSPANGFCSGTLTLNGVSGSGKAVCLVSTSTPEWMLACSAQYPSDNRITVSILARVPEKALLALSLDQAYYSVALGNSATITATLKNLSGKAIPTMGNPSNGSLQLAAPYSNAGAWAGTSGSCGSSLAGYASCTTTITYNSGSVGTHFQTFRVAYDDGYFGTVNATASLIGTTGLTSIDVTPATASFAAGSVVQYIATATYTGGSTQDITKAVAWSSNASSVATIDANGVANFVQTGSVTFTATMGAVSDNQAVTSSAGGSVSVLGQPDPNGLAGALTGMSAPSSMVIAAGRMFVVDTSNHRVLIWDSLPSSSATPADLVLGQPDLDTLTANTGGISASTLNSPRGIASDGTRLVVADRSNNRVLIWTSLPTTTGQAADLVLGQTGFTTNTNDQGGIGLNTLDDPAGVAISGTGVNAKLIVSDRANHRILIWSTFPTSNKQAANYVLGQSANNGQSANAGTGSVSASGVDTPEGVATDGTALYVADYNNNRVLMWDTIPIASNTPANRALGQANLVSNTNTNPPTANSLTSPVGVYVYNGYLFVADSGNNRALMWVNTPTTNGEAASYVQGQSLMTTRTANNGGIGSSTLNVASGVFAASSKLYVVDTTNNRILIWNSIPTANKSNADVVLGQPNFTYNQVNSVGIPTASTMRQPTSVSKCGNKLFVADASNHRVLIWNTIPTSDGQAADLVLGQPDFASNTANNGGRASTTLSNPQGVYCDGTRLFVADTGNHRVLIWSSIPTASQQGATYSLGQTLLTQGTSNQGGLGAATLSSPRGVYSTGTKLFVADSGNNRVQVWTTIPSANKTAANFTLGQPDQVSNTANNGGISASTMQAPYSVNSDGTRLFVADRTNHRVLMWNTLPTVTAQAADLVLGQTDFTTNASNQGGVGATTLRNPSGVFADGTSLFIADYSNHRVLIHDTYPTTNKETADRVIGQPTFTAVTANNGGVDGSSLNNPFGVYSDGNRVFTADYNNMRVTVVSVKAKLVFTEAPSFNYGDIVVGNTSIKAYTITNLGAQTATLMTSGTPALSSPFSFVGGSYPGTSGTCGASLAGQASCTIRVQFAPTLEAATFNDVIRVSYNDGVGSAIAVVSVTGRSVLQSALTFTAGASYNYGSVTVNTGVDHTFTVQNSSGVLATQMKQGTPALSGMFVFKGGQYPGTGGTCGTVMATGNTCTVVIRFTPTSTGAKSATLYQSYFNGSSTTQISISLSGTGS